MIPNPLILTGKRPNTEETKTNQISFEKVIIHLPPLPPNPLNFNPILV
jgi:hypothetical protein